MRSVLLATLFLAVLAAPASAADYVVNATHDEGDGNCLDGSCTLRDAVNQAGPSDVVRIGDGTYELTEGEITLAGDTIVGESARFTTIDAVDNSRVFYAGSGTNVISDVTITGGDGQGTFSRVGGGILVRFGSLALVESTLRANDAGQGGGIANSGGTLSIIRSTLMQNLATEATSGAAGGGIYSAGTTYLRNSTVSDNAAGAGEGDGRGGGIFLAGGTFVSQSSTIADNRATNGINQDPIPGSALAGHPFTTTTATLSHTVIGLNGPAACDDAPFQGAFSVIDDATCGTVGAPFLDQLSDNGGPTDTHSISVDSDAVDVGGSCEPSDQRGRARVNGCDSGAYETSSPAGAPPVLWVVTEVVNNSGGTLTPGQVNVHVRAGGVDDDESPQTGTPSGRSYTISPDATHTVSAAASGYTTTVAGHCAPGGTITLQNSDTRVCTVRLDDVGGSQQPPPGGGGPQPPPPDDGQQLPDPEPGETVNVLPEGTVKIKLPGRSRFRVLAEGEQLPVGTVVDTLKGRVTLVAAGGQAADFYAGIFRIGQGRGARPLTTLTLVEALSCPRAGRAVAAAKKKKRRLWGDGSGRFRTKGKHSAATVVGTKWLVEDRCTSTLTRVEVGRVRVRDFIKKKTVTVRAGKKYVARAKKP